MLVPSLVKQRIYQNLFVTDLHFCASRDSSYRFKIFYFLTETYLGSCQTSRSYPQEVFLGKGVLKFFSKFTGEHPCRNVILIKLLCNFIEITLLYGCSPVNLLRTPMEGCFRASMLKYFVKRKRLNYGCLTGSYIRLCIMGTTTIVGHILNLTYCITKRNGKKLGQLITKISRHELKLFSKKRFLL